MPHSTPPTALKTRNRRYSIRLAPASAGITARRNAVKRPGDHGPAAAPAQVGLGGRDPVGVVAQDRGPDEPRSELAADLEADAVADHRGHPHDREHHDDRDLAGVGQHPAVHDSGLAGQHEPEEQCRLPEDQGSDDQQGDPRRHAEERVDDLLQHRLPCPLSPRGWPAPAPARRPRPGCGSPRADGDVAVAQPDHERRASASLTSPLIT